MFTILWTRSRTRDPVRVYDVGRNNGWVSVGVDHDTAEFAVETIRRWWRSMGRPAYPKATRLLIAADAGGSNGSGCDSGRSRFNSWPTKQTYELNPQTYPAGIKVSDQQLDQGQNPAQ
jgi:hypothetical protein